MSDRERQIREVRFPSVKRENVAVTVHRTLRKAILDRRFTPGEKLEVPVIATQFGVSQTPVRQAIQTLNTEGLVEIRPRVGTFVARISRQDIADTFDIRTALESMAAERGIDSVNEVILARLSDLAERIHATPDTYEGRDEHEHLNTEFHEILIGLSGNARLAEIYRTLMARLKIAHVYRGSQSWIDRLAHEHSEHVAIIEALRKRDASAAREAVKVHIDLARDDLFDEVGSTAEEQLLAPSVASS